MGALIHIVIEIFTALGGVILGAAGNVAADEYKRFANPISRYLIEKAAERLPDGYRARYEAEWLGLLADISSPSLQIITACSLWLKVGHIRAALPTPKVKVAPYSSRFLDITIAFGALIFFTPLLLFIAIVLTCSMRGQSVMVSYWVEGANGRRFRRFKFRTIREVGDTRTITRVGRAMRRSSMDELPTLINVLLGDMSFVGPPPAPSGLGVVEREKPGLVGPAEVPTEEWMVVKWSRIGLRLVRACFRLDHRQR